MTTWNPGIFKVVYVYTLWRHNFMKTLVSGFSQKKKKNGEDWATKTPGSNTAARSPSRDMAAPVASSDCYSAPESTRLPSSRDLSALWKDLRL